MSNHIVEFRYFISSIVKSLDNNPEWLNDAREFECKCIAYSNLRLRARVRDFKQAIRNLFKGE